MKLLEHIKVVLKDANLSKSDIDEIIMVGGSTRLPKAKPSCKRVLWKRFK